MDLIEKVKESFSLAGEIVLQKYLDEWAEWVDVSPPEISDFHITRNAFCFPHKILHKLLFSNTLENR